jgi:hypothetical protein
VGRSQATIEPSDHPLTKGATKPPAGPDRGVLRVNNSWLYRPLSGRWCALAWLAATAIFVGLVRFHGGPAQGDTAESAYSTWAIAHGHFACAYPSVTTHDDPLIAPLWPLISGAVAALLRIGHGVPFPSQAVMGPHCSNAITSIFEWSVRSGAPLRTYAIGYLSWLVLMAGVVALLRTVGRGRSGWEAVAVLVLACVPVVWMPLNEFFHPQDIVAMGLVLGCVACTRRGWWVWSGVLVALAITSQQFALLVLAPLVMVVPRHRRARFIAAAVGAAAVVVAPFVVASSGRAFRAVVLGSGNTRSFGGTVLWELHLHGALLVGLSRVLPIIAAGALAWWVSRRLGSAALEPVPLISLIATSLSLRLAFEQNLFGYYFMALAVMLLMLNVVRGRIEWQLIAWLTLVTVAFNAAPWGFILRASGWSPTEHVYLPTLVMAAGACVIVLIDAAGDRLRWYEVASFAVLALALARLPGVDVLLRHQVPVWFWQLALVGTGVAMAAGPLIAAMRGHGPSQPDLIDEAILAIR